jgi:hypothetical protein
MSWRMTLAFGVAAFLAGLLVMHPRLSGPAPVVPVPVETNSGTSPSHRRTLQQAVSSGIAASRRVSNSLEAQISAALATGNGQARHEALRRICDPLQAADIPQARPSSVRMMESPSTLQTNLVPGRNCNCSRACLGRTT